MNGREAGRRERAERFSAEVSRRWSKELDARLNNIMLDARLRAKMTLTLTPTSDFVQF